MGNMGVGRAMTSFEDDKEWLKGTPFSKWFKRLEKLESILREALDRIDGYDIGMRDLVERLDNP